MYSSYKKILGVFSGTTIAFKTMKFSGAFGSLSANLINYRPIRRLDVDIVRVDIRFIKLILYL